MANQPKILTVSVLVIAALLSAAQGSSEPEERFVMGTLTTEQPSVGVVYFVDMIPNNQKWYRPLCSVTVVSAKQVITSAGCILNALKMIDTCLIPEANRQLYVGLGMKSTSVTDMEADGVYNATVSRSNVQIHTDYNTVNPSIRRYDIALINLTMPLDNTTYPPMFISNNTPSANTSDQYMVSWGQLACNSVMDAKPNFVAGQEVNCSLTGTPPTNATDQFCSEISIYNTTTPSFATLADDGASLFSYQFSGPNGTLQYVIRGLLAVQPKMQTGPMTPLSYGYGCSKSSILLFTALRQTVNNRFLTTYGDGIQFTTIYNENM